MIQSRSLVALRTASGLLPGQMAESITVGSVYENGHGLVTTHGGADTGKKQMEQILRTASNRRAMRYKELVQLRRGAPLKWALLLLGGALAVFVLFIWVAYWPFSWLLTSIIGRSWLVSVFIPLAVSTGIGWYTFSSAMRGLGVQVYGGGGGVHNSDATRGLLSLAKSINADTYAAAASTMGWEQMEEGEQAVVEAECAAQLSEWNARMVAVRIGRHNARNRIGVGDLDLLLDNCIDLAEARRAGNDGEEAGRQKDEEGGEDRGDGGVGGGNEEKETKGDGGGGSNRILASLPCSLKVAEQFLSLPVDEDEAGDAVHEVPKKVLDVVEHTFGRTSDALINQCPLKIDLPVGPCAGGAASSSHRRMQMIANGGADGEEGGGGERKGGSDRDSDDSGSKDSDVVPRRSVQAVMESRGIDLIWDKTHQRLVFGMAKQRQKQIRRDTQRRVRESTGGLCSLSGCPKPGTMQVRVKN